MLKKMIAIAIILMGSIPMFSNAADLTIVNNTNRDSTSIINNGACSKILGEHGITRAHSTNVVPSSIVTFACLANRSNCTAKVFMTDNCTGPAVALAVFDTQTGIKKIDLLDNSYQLTNGAFNIIIDGGPAAK